MGAEVERQLLGLLSRSRALGFLGPGPVEAHVDHARGLLPLLGPVLAGARLAELGTGGGVPGLVLAAVLAETSWCFVEANQRRARFLREVVGELGWDHRAEVWAGRAEELGRRPGHRGSYDFVIARAFGRPAVTAECGAPLLAPSGLLVVSEPPEPSVPRWPADGLAQLGLRSDPLPPPDHGPGAHAVRLRLVSACPDRYPRRVGVPAKRPLF